MKIGVSISINVEKIEKARLYKGAKGTYLDLTTFIDLDNKGQYGDNGFICQTVSEDERNAGTKTPILGNCKVFYNDQPPSERGANSQGDAQPSAQGQPGGFDFDEGDDLAF